MVNPLCVWPVVARRNQPGDRYCRCASGFHSAGVYHRAGSGFNDRHRRFQEVDTYGISIPITKHNYLVRDISELPQVISDAFRIAQSGRRAVWIDIPKDVQTAEIEIDVLPEPGERAPRRNSALRACATPPL